MSTTAPAIAGAVEYVNRVGSDPEVTLLILPADHVIENFQNVALLAAFVLRATQR